MNYKASEPRFSEYHNDYVVDILKRKMVLWIFPVWTYHDTILHRGQVKEVIFLLNNPDELKRRLDTYKTTHP